MGLWDWLFGREKKAEAYDVAPRVMPPVPARTPTPAPPVPTPAAPPPVPAGMQQLQLHAPAAVPTSYGIQRAIELMRALPVDDDPALVLRVMRKTLRSTGVSLEEIIETAGERESAIVKGIESDRATIEQLEIQITTRKANIVRLEADLEETRSVRDRIEEAIQSETKVGSIAPEEMLRIRAEAAEKKKASEAAVPPKVSTAPPLPHVPAPKVAPPVPSRPPPKLPATSAMPPKPKPVETKPPGLTLPKPFETKPAEAKPAQTISTKPPEVKPADAKPSEPQAPESKPADSKPSDVKPVEAKPVDVKPVEASTADAKPPEPTLVDAKVPSSREPLSSIPDLGEIDDGFAASDEKEETTAKHEIDVNAALAKAALEKTGD